ncbi:MAG: redoxin family protein [Sedimentisphaerales bacterium]|nr:redoxin family protein [Sedimentisphaerales bacterium]
MRHWIWIGLVLFVLIFLFLPPDLITQITYGVAAILAYILLGLLTRVILRKKKPLQSLWIAITCACIVTIAVFVFVSARKAQDRREYQRSEKSQRPLSRLEGRVCDPNGIPVGWIKVRYFYYSGEKGKEWPFEGPEKNSTDANGHYSFIVPAGRTYHIEAGGYSATAGRSNKVTTKPDEVCRIEDITVRPARSSVSGIVLAQNGNPVSDIEFVAFSRSFQPTRHDRNPYTRIGGEFRIDNVLPDERLAICILPSRNRAQIWKKIKPDSHNLKLILDPEKEIELPPGWRYTGGLWSMALANTSVAEQGLRFSLLDFERNTVSLADSRYKNKVVLINIWGTWCGGCMEEIPHLIQMQNKYAARGLEIIGIAFERDNSPEGWEKVKNLAREKGINYTILKGGLEKRLNVETTLSGLQEFKGYPTTLFLDRDGKCKHIQVGFFSTTPQQQEWQIHQMEMRIEDLLNK